MCLLHSANDSFTFSQSLFHIRPMTHIQPKTLSHSANVSMTHIQPKFLSLYDSFTFSQSFCDSHSAKVSMTLSHSAKVSMTLSHSAKVYHMNHIMRRVHTRTRTRTLFCHNSSKERPTWDQRHYSQKYSPALSRSRWSHQRPRPRYTD